MHTFYLGLKFSLSYFTILPMHFKASDDVGHPPVLSSMLFFFPLVGVLLSAITLILYHFLLAPLQGVGAFIAAVVYMLLYGFIHTEAISDCVDALYAKHSGKDAYKVIKEAHIGAMGMLYTLAFVLIKVALLGYMLSHALYSEFIAVTLCSRFALVVLMKTLHFRSSFVTSLQEALVPKMLFLSFMVTLLVGIFLLKGDFLLLLTCTLVFAFIVATRLAKGLGFLNGDGLGATLELCEALLFLGIALWH
ncbi:adenosylcobinamide-GDP ribazoletransferase [Sulfurospirillum barnesii]|uniref:Adenosylcobinamide-GDP ribazoletransferase n=1 Tax=Sulfurospirillum barnesii (strain ATCC 700032 / DSM 10660 / SES-3) TaxID=760154 RepID=I3XZP0_SULBS|nr:adenosylcobinamide-GDP ribazoletransferase [Sulfurospirillum barnesii]AFL69414.1 cobalamin-5-phosphate synthase [Sulfurospirillum barnesii SES-3]